MGGDSAGTHCHFITWMGNECTICRDAGYFEEEQHISSFSAIPAVLVFPNPVSSNLTIQAVDGKISKINIRDFMGKTIYQKENVSLNLYHCDLRKFTAGIYVIETTINNTTYRNKIILAQ